MTPRSTLTWGNVPVPYAALWSGEAGKMYIGTCPITKRFACMDADARGEGKPIFGKPHMNRQREVVFHDLCDLCAKPMKMHTRVSLSHARLIASGAGGPTILQVEPLLHKACAAISAAHCPSLKRDIAAGTINIRHVLKHAVQFAVLTAVACEEFTGEARSGVIGHAKVELLRWRDRDLSWLQGGNAA
ncbi:hypothetical protein HGO34_15645 [Agrobacterium vitis]|uniref:hypothetical protein n=2 Tax=Agrobacterium vitis TaxID=373 RepID=UPI0012E914CE|nr:hypothetical protein [Agrobacterium vitis]MCM2441155.1 hypothetical protein [Agrobacterium vitis]MVA47251.1 hypothetical protein [Agrobacterium vitis]